MLLGIITWYPAAVWTQRIISAYMAHPRRSSDVDPELHAILEWCRVGRGARFVFRCELLNPRNTNRNLAVFELTLTDLLGSSAYRASLTRIGFCVQDRVKTYSDQEAESAYTDPGHRGRWHRVAKRARPIIVNDD